MGKSWVDAHPASAQTFAAADEVVDLGGLGRLSNICFEGPADSLNRTDVSQPALFTAAVASYQGLLDRWGGAEVVATLGLSLGEYTALHLAGAFGFKDGLRLVATRGRLMQEAAEASQGGMVALVGADETQAVELCEEARGGDVLVPANFNATGPSKSRGRWAFAPAACRSRAHSTAHSWPPPPRGWPRRWPTWTSSR
jgi:[acyl-carrier-protein] S-malonyltransferase